MNLSYRHYYWRWLKNLSFLFVLFAALMTLARLGFTLYYGDFSNLLNNPAELRKAFFLGFRFDLMPLAYINALPFILLNVAYFLPGKITIKIIRFLVVNLLALGYFALGWLFLFDYSFYYYFQDHLNVLVFGFFEDDTVALIITLYKNHNLLLGLTIILFLHYGLYRFIKFLFSPFDFDLKARQLTYRIPMIFIAGLTLIALMARGNFSRLPLSVEDAFISDNKFINEVAINGALTLNRAVKIRKTHGKDQYDYLKNYGLTSWQEAFEVYTGNQPKSDKILKALTHKTKTNPAVLEQPPHVILIVMESFGSYWNEINSSEFNILGELKKHFEEDYLFNNFLPAENGTIGSIVSVITSQVTRPGSRYLSESDYMRTHLASSGHMAFKENGYDTHFVYGGKLGWRDLGKYLSTQKYDKLWGADEIKNAMPELNHFSPRDLGNEWGIFDEYLYAFIDEELRTATKPQFFLVLTTSNHPPYEFPSSYSPLPLSLNQGILDKISIDAKLAKKRFLGFQYANQKAGNFLTKIKSSSLRDKTIVALTGDHSFWIAKGVGQEEEFKRFAVPFYLSIPDRYKPEGVVDTKKFGSHEDIFPTLINLSLSDATYIKLGEDLIHDHSFALNSTGLTANKEGAFLNGKFWKWKNMSQQVLEETDETPELLSLKKKGPGQISLTDMYLKSEKKRRPTGVDNDLP